MSRVLIMSVGTGIGGSAESLAHALRFSVEDSNPDHIVYVASAESKETLVPLLHAHQTGARTQVIVLDSIDDLQTIFNQLNPVFRSLREEYSSLYVDFTSGTKAMTSSLAMLAVLYEANCLSNVVGKRVNGLVQKGTETLNKVFPLFATAEHKLRLARSLFNSLQFTAALQILSEIRGKTNDPSVIHRVEELEVFAEGFKQWDLFNQDEALKNLQNLKNPCLDSNKRFLNMLGRVEDKAPYLVADLLNNARRRGDTESKYDDAVARLYRVIELIGQHRLRQAHGLDPSNLPVSSLPTGLRAKWSETMESDHIKVGLFKTYELLSELNDPFGGKINDNRLRDLLTRRNYSILAHGLQPVGHETYIKLYEMVYTNAAEIIPKLQQLLEDSSFPQL